jgi:5-deoxy-glucuronate isomerase
MTGPRGNCSRQVHNFGTAGVFEADSLIACEVITPGGNWSSYPAHKHGEESPVESQLGEIYYFEIDCGPGDSAGFGYHRVYGTPERPIEVLEEVRSGDVVLVPHGYHGPSVAAPGYHMYYLNMMAGWVRNARGRSSTIPSTPGCVPPGRTRPWTRDFP